MSPVFPEHVHGRAHASTVLGLLGIRKTRPGSKLALSAAGSQIIPLFGAPGFRPSGLDNQEVWPKLSQATRSYAVSTAPVQKPFDVIPIKSTSLCGDV